MAPYNPDKNGVNAVICHAVSTSACWVTVGSRVPRVTPAYLTDACCLSVPLTLQSTPESSDTDTALYLLCTVDAFLVLYPKLHRLFRIMVSLKNEC